MKRPIVLLALIAAGVISLGLFWTFEFYAGDPKGWCSVGGDPFRAPREECEERGGVFSRVKGQARDKWERQQGWCLAGEALGRTSRGVCDGKKGRFFLKEELANKVWMSQKGWCNTDAVLSEVSRADCLKRKGKLFKKPVPPFDDSGGIRITVPTNDHLWYAGTVVTVRYRFTGDGTESGPVIFYLFNRDTNRYMAHTQHDYHPSYGDPSSPLPVDESFVWDLPPELLASSQYYIFATGVGFSGISDTFTIEPLVDMGGAVDGIEILEPTGENLFRPGDAITVRYRFTDPDRPRPENLHISLRYASLDPVSGEPGTQVGPETAETDIVIPIPDGVDDWINGYVIVISGTTSGGTESQTAVSRIFDITSATVFGDGEPAPGPAEAQLEVLAPGLGGEYWNWGRTHDIRWRFYRGGSTIPGTWLVTLLRHTETGYRIDRSFTPARYEVREVNDSGLPWLEHSIEWIIPHDISDGDYKIRVSGLTYQDDGALNFYIGTHQSWDLSITDLSSDFINLVAGIHNEGGRLPPHFAGFLVESLDVREETLLSSQRTFRIIPGTNGPVTLGRLDDLAPERFDSDPDCGNPLFRVTVDADNRIDEESEGNNTLEALVRPPARVGQVEVMGDCWAYGCNEILENGSEITYPGSGGPSSVFGVYVRSCGAEPASGHARLYQQGTLIDDWDIEAHTAKHIARSDIELVDSDIEIQFEGDIVNWIDSPSFMLHLRIEEE